MNPFPIIRASWRRYPGTALATVLLVALAVALGTAVSLLEPSIRRGAAAAADRFDLVVGAPGARPSWCCPPSIWTERLCRP